MVKKKTKKSHKPAQISLHKGNIIIDARRDESRTEVIGFGRFLQNYKPGDVEITQEALDVLLQQPYRSGLQGAEFFDNNTIAWGDPNYIILLAPKDISVHKGAGKMIKTFKVVTKDKVIDPFKAL